jgi:hypothetical protein
MTDDADLEKLRKFKALSCTWFSGFDPAVDFADEHWYEQYDPTHDYDYGEFERDYGRGLHRYRLYYKRANSRNYILAKQVFSDEEHKRIAEFCCCPVCEMAWYQPFMLLACAHCYGCLKLGNEHSHMCDAYYLNVAQERERAGFVRPKVPLSLVIFLLLVLLAILVKYVYGN